MQRWPQQPDDLQAKAEALYDEGIALFQTGQLSAALSKYKAALPLFQAMGQRACEGAIFSHIGAVYYNQHQYPQALECYKQALVIAHDIGHREGEGTTLSNIGNIYFDQGQYSVALDYHQQALFICRAIGNREWEGTTLNNIGNVCHHQGQFHQALEFYQQALFIHREIGNRINEGTTLSNIGNIHSAFGQYEQALNYYQQALAITEEIGERANRGAILNKIGNAYHFLGQYNRALEFFQQALVNLKDFGDRAWEGITLGSIGSVCGELGRYQQALNYHQQALFIHRDIGNRAEEGTTLKHIGLIYEFLGHHEQALEYYQQALAIKQDIGQPDGEGATLNYIGRVYHHLGRSEQALDYYQQALDIARAIGYQQGEGMSLSNIGSVYFHKGLYEQALNYLQQTLFIYRQTGYRAGQGVTLNNLGNVYHHQEKYDQALESYQQALLIKQEIGDRANEGITLRNIGFLCESRGDTAAAITFYQQAVEVAESIQGEIKIQELKASFASKQINTYERLIDLLWQESRFEEALNYVERSRARAFLDQLANGSRDFRTSSASRLLKQEQAIKTAIAALRTQLVTLLNRPMTEWNTDAIPYTNSCKADLTPNVANTAQTRTANTNANPNKAPLLTLYASLQAELTAYEKDYTNLLTQLKLQSPEIASLVSVDVATLNEIQALLDADTTLVEYFVTENFTLAFVITRDRFKPSSKAINGQNLSFRNRGLAIGEKVMYGLRRIISPDPSSPQSPQILDATLQGTEGGFKSLLLKVSREDLSKKIEAFRRFVSLKNPHPNSLQQLHEWLIVPLKPYLTTSRLAIVPHGVLHYLPFAALTDGERYLSDDYTLFTLSSASLLRFLPQKRKPKTGTLLALGNPTTTEALPTLRFAEKEVKAIASLYGTQALVGKAATESVVLSQSGNAEILHIAAHGQFNKYNPLFSTLYLAADTEHDGRLEVHDIYGLDLTKATNLVVLSACQTQLGELSKGDEVVGLNRAFLYAGTPSVMATLWSVKDDTTALLMERFYTHLQSGMTKAQALRQAQMDVRVEYPHPYYWAAFVLTGEGGI